MTEFVDLFFKQKNLQKIQDKDNIDLHTAKLIKKYGLDYVDLSKMSEKKIMSIIDMDIEKQEFKIQKRQKKIDEIEEILCKKD